MSKRSKVGPTIAIIGFLFICVEIGFYWQSHLQRQHYDMNPIIIGIGTIAVFVGGALMDFRRAQEITGVVVNSGVTILGAIPLPFGKRWTDRVAAGGPSSPPAASPPPRPTPDPVVTEEHD